MKKTQHLLALILLIFIWDQTIVKADTNSAPSIASVSPNIVQQGDTVDFVIKGHNTHFTKGLSVTFLGANPKYEPYTFAPTIINDSIITAKCYIFYPWEGLFHIYMQTVQDGTLRLDDCINILIGPSPPSFTITPTTGVQGETIHFDIKGTNTHFLNSNVGAFGVTMHNEEKKSHKYPTDIVYVNDSVLKATFDFDYKDSIGKYNVYINDFDAAPPVTLLNGFTLMPGPKSPSLKSISPSTAAQGSFITLRIQGNNTHFLTGTYKLSIGGQEPVGIHLMNDSTMDVDFQFTYILPPGLYSLQVKNSIDGPLDLINVFTLTAGSNPPSLKSISPAYGRQDDTLTIAIIGKNTHFLKSTSIELQNKNGSSVLPIAASSMSDTLTKATFVFSNAFLGEYDVRVNNYDFGPIMILPKAFTLYSAGASIVSVSPDTATIGNTVQITAHSLYAHYLSGTTTMQLKSIYGGTPVSGSNVTVVNDSTVTATFSFTNFNFTGKYSMIINNTVDGIVQMDSVFMLNGLSGLPYIVSVYPKEVAQGYSATITVEARGTHFQQGVDTILLGNWPKNIYPLSMTILNDTTIKASFAIPVLHPIAYYQDLDIAIWGDQPLVLNKGLRAVLPVNISQIERAATVVYPNPSGGIFTIRLDQEPDISEIEVMDLTGRIIYHQSKAGDLIQVDISSYANGMYYLRLLGANTAKNIKIIKE
jgi:hypothetical protein